MADVFLSYASEDRPTAEKISRGLQANGISVWWDRHIRGGVNFGTEIEHQLAVANTVVVLWSAQSQNSIWVRDEASYARDQNKLMPVRIDDVQVPMGFRQLQALDFAGWDGDFEAGAFASLLDSLRHPREIRHMSDIPVGTGTPTSKRNRRWVVVTATGVAIVAAIAIAVWRSTDVTPVNNGRIELVAFTPSTPGDEAATFAKTLPEEIARVFATNDLRVIAPNQAAEAPDRAEFKLQGTVEQVGTDLVATADLLHQRDGLVLWSTTMSLDRLESRLLQERLAIKIADVLRCALHNRKLVHEDPSPDLLRQFINACAALRYGPVQQLPELARRIVETAPQYAATHAAYAAVMAGFSNASTSAGAPRPESDVARLRELAYEHAQAAIAIDPKSALAYYAMAMVNDPTRTLAQKEQLLLKATSLDPEDLNARHEYARLLNIVGRIRESMIVTERLVDDYPLNQAPRLMSAYLAAWLGNIEVARRQYASLREMKGKPLTKPTIDFDVSISEFWFGDPDAAKRLLDDEVARQFAVAGGPPNCPMTILDARSNHRQLTETELKSACSPSRRGNENSMAAYYGMFGHVDAAYREYEAHEQSTFDYLTFLPHMHAVRADPRFMTFAAHTGLVDYWLDSDQWPDFCNEEQLPYNCKEAALSAHANIPASERNLSPRYR